MDFSSPSSRSNSGDPKYFVLFHLNGHYPLGHCHHGQKVQLMYVFSKYKLLGYLNLVKTSVFLRVSSGLWHLCCHSPMQTPRTMSCKCCKIVNTINTDKSSATHPICMHGTI